MDKYRKTMDWDPTASILVSSEDRRFYYLVIFLFEFIAFTLVAYGITSAHGNKFGIAIALSIGILIGGRLTGGQYNPVVSVALTIIRENPKSTLPFYLLGQFGGAFMGGFLCWCILDAVNSPYPQLSGGLEYFRAFMGECLGTFVLVHFVLCQVHKSTTFTNDPVLVGLLFFFVLYGCIQLSYKTGSVFNPALAFSLQLFTAIITKQWGPFEDVWIYILGPFCGGLLATVFFSYVTKPWMKKIKKIKEVNEQAMNLRRD